MPSTAQHRYEMPRNSRPYRNRRELITLLRSTAATWALSERAQQKDRVRRIGMPMGVAEDDAGAQARNAAWLQGLAQLGWTRRWYRRGLGRGFSMPRTTNNEIKKKALG